MILVDDSDYDDNKAALLMGFSNLGIVNGYSVTRLGNFLDFWQIFKPLATINLPKSTTLLGKFCQGVKIFHFSSEIIFGHFL